MNDCRNTPKIDSASSPVVTDHSRDLLLALSRTAQSIQRARTEEEVYRAVGDQIKSLGGEATLLMVNDDCQSLSMAYTSYSSKLIRKAEKITGLSLQEYRVPFSPTSIYGRALNGGKTIFIDSTSQAIAEVLPESLHPFINPIISLFNLHQGALCPLRVDDEILGLLKVNGSFLNGQDLSAMESFAGQIAVGLQNVRLMQKLQDELAVRKQAEESLKKSEAQYRLLADHTTDTIWMSDMNLKTTYVSPSLERIRGYTLEELHELPLEQNLTPASFQLALEVFATEIPKVYADPDHSPVVTLELDFLNRDGTIYSTETKLSIVRDENRNPVSILGESRDIAERKQAEKALLESEGYYRTLIENATDGILVVNMDGTIRYESPSVTRMLGHGPDALIGTSTFDLIHPDDLASILAAFAEGLQIPGFIHRGEYRLRHSGGEWRYFEIICHFLLKDPVVAGVIVNGRDITDRKQAEEALVKSEKQYRLLAERMADVVWVLDARTMRFKYVSPSVEKLLGYTPEEILGLSLEQILLPDSLEFINMTFPDRVRQFQEGDRTAVTRLFTLDQRRKDGSSITVEIISKLVVNEKMDLEVVGVSRDITQRKQAEDELRRANESLETAHRELQKMFAHEQLLARTDGLTRLYNRRYFFELATREFKASMRYQRPLTIILFDLDGFKQINDTFGHATGDAILFQIAQTAAAQIRNVDILARYGGDEFVILLPQTHAREAFLIAERVRNSVAATHTHVTAENSPFAVTLSLGVSEILLSPQDESVEDIIRRADKALYKVKQNGNNQTLIFTPDSIP